MAPALSPAEIRRAIRSSLPIGFRTVTAVTNNVEMVPRELRAYAVVEEAYAPSLAAHAEMGARVAAKWSSSPVLASGICHHHEPMEAPEDHRAVAASIYLANLFAIYGEAIGLAQIDLDVRARFGLGSKEKLHKVRLRLAESYHLADDPVPAREPC